MGTNEFVTKRLDLVRLQLLYPAINMLRPVQIDRYICSMRWIWGMIGFGSGRGEQEYGSETRWFTLCCHAYPNSMTLIWRKEGAPFSPNSIANVHPGLSLFWKACTLARSVQLDQGSYSLARSRIYS